MCDCKKNLISSEARREFDSEFLTAMDGQLLKLRSEDEIRAEGFELAFKLMQMYLNSFSP